MAGYKCSPTSNKYSKPKKAPSKPKASKVNRAVMMKTLRGLRK